MGIAGLWDVIGEGDICTITDYAARHFEKHKRPLRIAVDEACWRFTNLTPEQVQKIREGEEAANPVEKVILWRILRLLKLNIQLLFVNDGPRRPWKRGKRGGGKLDHELVKLTHQLLEHLKVPYHRAPGEAEAECARLQALGVVDAVWSDDGDALMFGCGTLIRQHKVASKIVKDQIRVYHAHTIQQKHDLDADSLVLFATLAGGDYNVQGLRGCGPKTAAILARRKSGLARALCHASERDLQTWRQTMQETMIRHDKLIEIPWTFPDYRALEYYRKPTVSTDEQLHNLRGLKNGWDRPIDQVKLRVFLRERFNFTTREYIKHIAPIFLTRRLVSATTSEKRAENLDLGIQLKRTRAKKDETDVQIPKSEAKITFSPMPVVEIDLSQRPPEEDWSKFDSKKGNAYDPLQNIDCEILHCFLQHGLPEGALEVPPKQKNAPRRKRKITDVSSDGSPTSQKPKKPKVASSRENHTSASEASVASPTIAMSNPPSLAPKKRGGPPKKAGPAALVEKIAKRENSDVDGRTGSQETPSAPVFQQPRSLPDFGTAVVNLCDNESESDNEDSTSGMPFPSRIVHDDELNRIEGPKVSISDDILAPGEIISADTLRRLRATSALLRKNPNGQVETLSSTATLSNRSGRPTPAEVIDLT